MVFYALLFVLAETSAFGALYQGHASGFEHGLVSTALLLYLVMVIFVPTQPHAEALLERTPLGAVKRRLQQRSDRKHKRHNRG
jgi:hypothetical protein